MKGKDNNARLEETLRNFHVRLKAQLAEIELGLIPAEGFADQPVKLTD